LKYLISNDHWDVEGYQKEWSLLETRLSKRAFKLLSKHTFHDAIIKSFTINNGGWNYDWNCKRHKENPTTIEAHLIDDMDGCEYTIAWGGVAKFEFSFDARGKKYFGSDGKLHHCRKDTLGIEEWGYSEITIHNKKYLSHEILLYSGATIILLFTNLDYRRANKTSGLHGEKD
jgi:hypothetical protein